MTHESNPFLVLDIYLIGYGIYGEVLYNSYRIIQFKVFLYMYNYEHTGVHILERLNGRRIPYKFSKLMFLVSSNPHIPVMSSYILPQFQALVPLLKLLSDFLNPPLH